MSLLRVEETPGHALRITDEWMIWKYVCLRGAGFAARIVDDLSNSELFGAVDELLEAQTQVDAARKRAIEACQRRVDGSSEAERRQLVTAIKNLRAVKLDKLSDPTIAAIAEIEELAHGRDTLVAKRELCKQRLNDATGRTSRVIRDVASDPLFREALAWQNRKALHGTVEGLLRRTEQTVDSETRRRELLVANYIQRYCVKNDTIGFFGPAGWGELVAGGEPIAVKAGPKLVRRRRVYFEHWCINALAVKFGKDPKLKPFLAPRRMPTIWVEGRVLHYNKVASLGMADFTAYLPAVYARALTLCDGDTTARDIALELTRDKSLQISELDEAYALLSDLADKHMITWTLEIPTIYTHPESTLRKQLQAIGDGAADVTTQALNELSELEKRKEALEVAAGDAEAVDRALDDLEQTFTRLTGVDGVRKGGETYAGRTLVYHDCTRDFEFAIGPDVLESVGPPLALLLQSARWFTFTVAQGYRKICLDLYRELSALTGNKPVSFTWFWSQIQHQFTGSQHDVPQIVKDAVDRLHAHWATLLQLSPDQRSMELTSAQLRDRVHKIFAAPHPGWPSARYHSPDILFAADSAEAIRQGNYSIVLGEMHMAGNTLMAPMFLTLHDNFKDLVKAAEVDLPTPRIVPMIPKERNTRAEPSSFSKQDFHLEIGSTRSWRARSNVISIANLVVEERNGTLVVRTRDDRKQFDIISMLDRYLTTSVIARFSMLPNLKHTPRVTIDRLVVARERWRFTPQEIPFANAKEPLDRVIEARRWRNEQGLPRYVFFKIPEEPKPFYLDFDSMIFVENFARMVRKASMVSISEMLPARDEMWLADASNQRYSSELRIVIVDPKQWRPPSTPKR